MNIKFISRQIKTEFDIETRYDIADEQNNIIDNAQGYGYKSLASAQKAAWYKFKGGREKKNTLKRQAYRFWKQNPKFKNDMIDVLEYNIKDPATNHELIEFAEQNGINNFNIKFLEYL